MCGTVVMWVKTWLNCGLLDKAWFGLHMGGDDVVWAVWPDMRGEIGMGQTLHMVYMDQAECLPVWLALSRWFAWSLVGLNMCTSSAHVF